MFKKRVTSIILAAALTVSMVIPAYADTQTDITNAEAAKQAAEASLSDANDKIDDMQSAKKDLQSYLDTLNAQLTELSDSLTDIASQMDQKQTEIEITKAAVERAKTEEQAQYDDMKARIKYMYENGKQDFVVSLLESRNITDFLNKAAQISELSSYDRNRLADFQNAKDIVIKQEAALEELGFELPNPEKKIEDK